MTIEPINSALANERRFSKLMYASQYQFEIWRAIADFALDPPIPFTRTELQARVASDIPRSLLYKEVDRLIDLEMLVPTGTKQPVPYIADGLTNQGNILWGLAKAIGDHYDATFGSDGLLSKKDPPPEGV